MADRKKMLFPLLYIPLGCVMDWVLLPDLQSTYIWCVCVCAWIYLWCVGVWRCVYVGELLRIRASKFRTQFQHSLVLWSTLLIVVSSSLKDDNANFSINVTRMLSIKSCQISILEWFTNHKYHKMWGLFIQAVSSSCVLFKYGSSDRKQIPLKPYQSLNFLL